MVSDAPSAPADSSAEAPADSSAEAPADSVLSEVSEVALDTDQDAPATAAAAADTANDDDAAAAEAPSQCNRTSQISSAVVHETWTKHDSS